MMTELQKKSCHTLELHKVLELLARERGIPPEQVLQEQEGSVVLAGGRI